MVDMRDLYDQLTTVHNIESRRFIYVSDMKQFKVKDLWPKEDDITDPPNTLVGDCDDFALACRKHLRAINIPNRVVICIVETGEAHMVCEVGGWILDNRQDKVMARDDLPYTWLVASGYTKDDPWRIIMD